MSKLPESLENPIDHIIIKIADKTDEIYKKLGMTANHLTTLSFFFGILTAYYIYKGNNKLAIFSFVLSYYYDCMDGNYARKNNMTSEFGDLYDHISDWLKIALIAFAMYKRNPVKFKYVTPILAVFSLIATVHLGCQERMTHVDHTQPILDHFEKLCPTDWLINYTRWFGMGTLILITSAIIYTY